jgi:DNA-binding transcriptional LysR family regulator
MDRLDAMRLFVRVAEGGSFSAVADQLGVARSVVTRQIAGLEAHLGVKLLARSTRRLALTAAGAGYLEKCRVILNLVEAAESGASEESLAPRGPIRLALPLSFGLKRLNPLLLDFAAAHPEVALDVDFSDRRSNLLEEGIDLAVRIAERLEPGDIVRRLGSTRLVATASPDYLARHGEPRHPDELIHHQCLAYNGALSPNAWQFLVDGRPTSFPIRHRLLANNGEALLEACIAGFGITYGPDFIAEDALAAGRLRVLLKDFPSAELGIYAVLPGNRYVPHRVRVLMDFLAEKLG